MKEHAGTTLVSTLEIVQYDVLSAFWRIVTVDELKGVLYSVIESKKRFPDWAKARVAGETALRELKLP